VGSVLAIAGLLLTSAGSLHALWLIPREAVPEQPHGHRLGLALGAVVAGAGVVLDPSLVSVPPALLALAIAAVHLRTLSDSALSPVSPAAVVGQPLPALTLLNEAGEPVPSLSWTSSRILLKVFRGHW
jgi:hypothetical protein